MDSLLILLMSLFSVQVCVILECAAEEAMGVSDLDRQIDQLKRRARLFLQLPELSVPQAPSYLTEWQGHGRVDAHIHARQISIVYSCQVRIHQRSRSQSSLALAVGV